MEENSMHHFIVVERPTGDYSAQPCGVPELAVSGATSAAALAGARAKFVEWVKQGKLIAVNVGDEKSQRYRNSIIANDEPMQQAFLEAIERSRREDLQATLAEYEAECPPISSTPTT